VWHPLCLQATKYRLELQQLKAEHAALQMLTHAEQETVSKHSAAAGYKQQQDGADTYGADTYMQEAPGQTT
jgi:hypothetical protein